MPLICSESAMSITWRKPWSISGSSMSLASLSMSRPRSLATASASALPIGPCMPSSLLWNAQNLSPGNLVARRRGDPGGLDRAGPEHREILEDELEVGVVLHQLGDVGQRALAVMAVVVEELDERRSALGVADHRLERRAEQRARLVATAFLRASSATSFVVLVERFDRRAQHVGIVDEVILDEVAELGFLGGGEPSSAAAVSGAASMRASATPAANLNFIRISWRSRGHGVETHLLTAMSPGERGRFMTRLFAARKPLRPTKADLIAIGAACGMIKAGGSSRDRPRLQMRALHDRCLRFDQYRPGHPRRAHPGAGRNRARRRLCDGSRRQRRQSGAGGAPRRAQRSRLSAPMAKTDSPRRALSLLAADGVDLAFSRATDKPTGAAFITVDPHGENAIVVAAGANALASAEQLKTLPFGAGDMLLLQREVPIPEVEAAAALARRRGAKVALNAAPAGAVSPALLARLDFLIVNEHEVEIVGAALGIAGEVEAIAQEIERRHGDRDARHARRGGRRRLLRTPRISCARAKSDGGRHHRGGRQFCRRLRRRARLWARFRRRAEARPRRRQPRLHKPGAQPSMPYADEIERLAGG